MNQQIQAGAYKTNITPPLGCCLAGDFSVRRSSTIQDDLFSHALVLDDGRTEASIISVDVCSIKDEDMLNKIRKEIEQTCGIPDKNIVIAATHTHSGPVLYSSLPEVFGEPDPAYVDFFIKQIVTSVRMAQKRKKYVKLSAGKGKNPHYVYNRRLQKPDGRIVMNWVEFDFIQDCMPFAPVDDEMIVGFLDGYDGRPVAILINYANHNNSVAGDVISADMAGVMRNILYKVYGNDIVVLFLLGACGDTNWVNFRDPNRFCTDICKRYGIGLAGTALEIMGRLEPLEVSSIRVAKMHLPVLERQYCDYDTYEDDTFGQEDRRREFFDSYRIDRQKYSHLPLETYNLSIQGIALGEQFAICTNPAELFCEYGIEIKQKSPFKYTMISELTNGDCGYIPTRDAFDRGGYEVRKIREGSYLEIAAGEKITAASIKILNQCKNRSDAN